MQNTEKSDTKKSKTLVKPYVWGKGGGGAVLVGRIPGVPWPSPAALTGAVAFMRILNTIISHGSRPEFMETAIAKRFIPEILQLFHLPLFDKQVWEGRAGSAPRGRRQGELTGSSRQWSKIREKEYKERKGQRGREGDEFDKGVKAVGE